ncbi:hypothetical protein FRC11_010456 [Ceratobasidium sp. 423]|nr:hypothetical protein FRC11_010456 [Ceratobasidium sp. 423]
MPVEREEWFPVSEHEPSPASPLGKDDEPFVNDRRNEFVYGLGEASGGILRTARKFTLEARDGAGYDWESDPETDNRHYFVWNRQRYPDPRALGMALEQEMSIRIIVNIKPWLLDDHPLYEEALKDDSYVKAAPDAPDPKIKVAKSLLWSNAPGEHMYGSYLDFSSTGAVEWWSRHIKEDIVGMNMTGMWIDNNEFSGLVDDEEVYIGKKSFWGGGEWESRLGWGGGETTVGQAGRLVQMMGMAKTTHDTMLEVFPDRRPIIVTRAASPGMQAYAHGTWSGDNATSWIGLRRGTAMTLSAGISFLPGLYGHDIGGFAGKHHPSPELLLNLDQGAWHTRFTVHSWKEVSTTLWMYDGIKVDDAEITSILRDVVGFRYQLIPTMYSLYVNEYWKKGWPVLWPMFWYHSTDPKTLALDEQFLFGSHILVAPVLSFKHRTKRVYLPSVVNGTNETPEWCELDTGAWHTSPSDGGFINMDAPLPRTPVLVRAGGVLVLSNKCAATVYDGEATRVAHIFPSLNSQVDGAKGSFKLVEDDGKTNEHAEKGSFAELELSFQVSPGEKGQQTVEVDIKELSNSYTLPYNIIWFILPIEDTRKLRVPAGSTRKTSEQKADDGRVMFGIHLS